MEHFHLLLLKLKMQDTRLKTQDAGLLIFNLNFVICILFCFILGCGSGWRGRIVHLEDGRLVMQSERAAKISSGSKILIYREKTITHPVNDQVLGTITDKIGEVPVTWVGNRIVTAKAAEPEFSMMETDDRAIAVRGSVKPLTGSAQEVGKISEVDAQERSVQIAVKPGAVMEPGGILTVIRYSDSVVDPNTGEVLAVAIEPVANLQIGSEVLSASYVLIDEKLGWVELDDVVVNRTGDMSSERLWFEDPPEGFSRAWIFNRSYLRAIRYYNSGLFREAVMELNDVIKWDPDYKDASYLMGLCYMNLKRYDDAVAQLRNILGWKPDDAKTWAALAYAYISQGNLTDAAIAYEKLTSLLPGDPGMWTDLGDIYRMLGDHQKAEQAYQKSLDISGDNEDAIIPP